MKIFILNFNRILLVAFILLVQSSCKKQTIPTPTPTPTPPNPTPSPIFAPPDFGFKVIGYFPSYRSVSAVPDVKFRMTNVVNYAFLNVSPTGLTLASPTTFTAVVAKAKLNNAKIFISVSGLAADFKTLNSTAPQRNVFVTTIMSNVRQYALDGVDMDWEFPSTADGSDVLYTSLMKELSDSLHTNGKYYLTAAKIGRASCRERVLMPV